jgi:hypothetical protein
MLHPLTIQVFYIPEDVSKMRDLGLDNNRPLEDYELREVTFYHIAAVSPYYE